MMNPTPGTYTEMRMMKTIRWSAVFVMLLITATGCGDDGEPEGANEEVFTASFSVRESIEQLHITKTAAINGDIACKSIIVDDGAMVNGSCKMSVPQTKDVQAKDMKAVKA